MNYAAKNYPIIPLCLIIASCSTIQSNPDNKPVRLIQNNELTIVGNGKTPDCRYLGEIVGSEGHWYSYLFLTNKSLTRAALNDLYNGANAIGANTVYVSNDLSFITSVTFYGHAYHCNLDGRGNNRRDDQ